MTHSEPKALLRFEDVGVSFQSAWKPWRATRKNWALSGVSFSLKRGESLGVIGRNGSGKSTLLQVLADVLLPDKGHVYREPGVTAALLALKVGFLPHLTGRENVYLSGMMLGMRKSQISDRIEDIIEFSGLGERFDDPFFTYSSGMKMRLGFSSSFQFEPDILLLDELLGVGDAAFKPKSAKVMRERIRSNATVVMVTHNTARIEDLCDRLIWIEAGKIMADGQPSEVLPEYNDFIHQLKQGNGVAGNTT